MINEVKFPFAHVVPPSLAAPSNLGPLVSILIPTPFGPSLIFSTPDNFVGSVSLHVQGPRSLVSSPLGSMPPVALPSSPSPWPKQHPM